MEKTETTLLKAMDNVKKDLDLKMKEVETRVKVEMQSI